MNSSGDIDAESVQHTIGGENLRCIENDDKQSLLISHAGSKKIIYFKQPLLLPLGAFLFLAVFVMFALNHTFTPSNLNDELQAAAPPHPLTCLGPPYLYVTIHDKVQNVLKYSRNGCLVDDNVLIMSEAYEKLNEVEFRSLAIGKHKVNIYPLPSSSPRLPDPPYLQVLL